MNDSETTRKTIYYGRKKGIEDDNNGPNSDFCKTIRVQCLVIVDPKILLFALQLP